MRRHSRRIFNLCYRFTNQRQEAEDLSQEVFMRVYKTLGSYRDIYGAFGTWVTSVTRNLLIDHYRRTRRDRLTDSMEDVTTQVESKESSGMRPDHSAAVAELGASEVMVGTGANTVKVTAFDAPPPGAGFVATTGYNPGVA